MRLITGYLEESGRITLFYSYPYLCNRYFLRAIICRELESPITTDLEFAVQLPLLGVMYNQGFEIQLRIADYLMIDVELNKINFHLDECLIGKITIEQIQLVIKKIQVSLVRREIYMPAPGSLQEGFLC